MRYTLSCIIITLLTVALSVSTSDAVGQVKQSPSSKATSHQDDGSPAYVTGITSGRARSLIGGVLAISSLIIGWRVRRSASESGNRRTWAILALVSGGLAIILSVVHLANVTGGFGTGGGRAGAIVAIVLGFAGTFISGLALRSTRPA